MLQRQGLIEVWHDRRMSPGTRLNFEIDRQLNEADVILLLISPDFLASDYCYKIEKSRALARHKNNEARLISVILRPCDWTHTELADFLVVPTDGRAITQWPDEDEAFLDVSNQIRRAVEELDLGQDSLDTHLWIEADMKATEPVEAKVSALPRSSNLRLKKSFTQADKDQFLDETFEHIAKYFEGSLNELCERNGGISHRLRQVNANLFQAKIYREGEEVASCTIFRGGAFGADAISYKEGTTEDTNSLNESLTVEHDDQSLYLKSMGFSMMGDGREDAKLSMAGASELYWSRLIAHLQ